MSKPQGFTYTTSGDDLVIIRHHGRTAATLKGREATRFCVAADQSTEAELQLRMAKLTGNYKRGNEKRSTRKS